jgi:hypothetical protein
MIAINVVVKNLESIWRMHKRREALYKMAMGLDYSNSFRKICGLGYMNALLFKKEIAMVYDLTKCSLTDGDLKVLDSSKEVENDSFIESSSLKQVLINQHRNMLHYYNQLVKEFDTHHEVVTLFKDHIAKLKELNTMLDADFTPMNYHVEAIPRHPQLV